MNKTSEYNVSARTIGRVVKADLGMKPFKYRDTSTKRGHQGQEKARSKLFSMARRQPSAL
ncbi:Hypothetical protein FKW44_017629 [Caligus rogercresseyi]|uniref:Uncharacterized protein n=1 Tax=Caligus rogercresseyi TaxID=217165 RepID=A0A7T8GTU9_CALRO|nr:Hypothetical protein FKW44_017629 [Caligus rogercresseyi]